MYLENYFKIYLENYFLYFSMKSYVVGTYWKRKQHINCEAGCIMAAVYIKFH